MLPKPPPQQTRGKPAPPPPNTTITITQDESNNNDLSGTWTRMNVDKNREHFRLCEELERTRDSLQAPLRATRADRERFSSFSDEEEASDTAVLATQTALASLKVSVSDAESILIEKLRTENRSLSNRNQSLEQQTAISGQQFQNLKTERDELWAQCTSKDSTIKGHISANRELQRECNELRESREFYEDACAGHVSRFEELLRRHNKLKDARGNLNSDARAMEETIKCLETTNLEKQNHIDETKRLFNDVNKHLRRYEVIRKRWMEDQKIIEGLTDLLTKHEIDYHQVFQEVLPDD